MTYIAFFLLVGRSLLRFFSSCSPFLLSVGDSFMPLRPSVHLCGFSLWGWIRWTSVSLLWLRRCCSCLSGCFIPLTQRYCSGPEMPVCTGVSVVRNLPMVRPRLSEKFLPSLKHILFFTVFVKTSISVVQLPTCCSSFVFSFSVLTGFHWEFNVCPRIRVCVCARVCLRLPCW